MAKRTKRDPLQYIVPLNMNGLKGRMLHMPAIKKHQNREILFIYGHHSSIERWSGLIQEINKFGSVTVPDLPGFGGMESLYKIGEKPDLDTLADYLASFIKLRYKRRRVTIIGLSFGFLVATRMLQRYPDLTKKVDFLISVVGFAHRDDFIFSKLRYSLYRIGVHVFSFRLMALVYRFIFLQPVVIKAIYHRSYNAKEKFAGLESEEFLATMEAEIMLWHQNDIRTHMRTNLEMLKVDNCKVRIDLPIWHVYVDNDRYFDANLVEQHFGVIFNEVHMIKSKLTSHAPSIIADAKAAAPLIPSKLRKLLS